MRENIVSETRMIIQIIIIMLLGRIMLNLVMMVNGPQNIEGVVMSDESSATEMILGAFDTMGENAATVDSIYQSIDSNIKPVAPYLQALSLQESRAGLDPGLEKNHSYGVTQIDPIRMFDFQRDYNEVRPDGQRSTYFHRGQAVNETMEKLGYKDFDISQLATVVQNQDGSFKYDANGFKYKDDPIVNMLLTRMLMFKDPQGVGDTPTQWDALWKRTWNTGKNAASNDPSKVDMLENLQEIERLRTLEEVNEVIDNANKFK